MAQPVFGIFAEVLAQVVFGHALEIQIVLILPAAARQLALEVVNHFIDDTLDGGRRINHLDILHQAMDHVVNRLVLQLEFGFSGQFFAQPCPQILKRFVFSFLPGEFVVQWR